MARPRYLHPFPARMAPSIALKAMQGLPKGAKVLDPMTGSGTVLRTAAVSGYDATGFDLDPLAVLMSKVWTTRIDTEKFLEKASALVAKAQEAKVKDISLAWIDKDDETSNFVNYWYAKKQQKPLRALAFCLKKMRFEKKDEAIRDALKIAFSKIIITKKKGASLAWDISHSRPHKKKDENDFDVFQEFLKSAQNVASSLESEVVKAKSRVSLGDARKMKKVKSGSIDIVITSPPYLNAIDYLRGHKFSLIWFGYKISEIRNIRGISIGAERKMVENNKFAQEKFLTKTHKQLPNKTQEIIKRYAVDACLLMKEVSRVTKKNGKAVFVVGNSFIKGVYISNSQIFVKAARLYGLELKSKKTRNLPVSSRYLPISNNNKNSLDKRMKREVVLEFVKKK